MSIDRSVNADTEEVRMRETLDERDIADRNRLIRKGRGVLDLCIKQNKLLCVQGFVDSQIERGGVYVEVVREMQEYIAAEMAKDHNRQERKGLTELHDYIAEKLGEVGSM